MLVLANVCNVGLAVWGNMYQNNFAMFLLAILMSNLILYTFFYIVMKVCTYIFSRSFFFSNALTHENLVFSYAIENGFFSHLQFISPYLWYFGAQPCISS